MAESKGKSAKKKAKIKLWIEVLILDAISIALIVVGSTLLESTDYLGGILMGLGVLWLFGGVIHFFSTRKRIKRSFCSKCGAKFNYDRDIGWSVTSTSSTAQKTTASIQIECSCPECGHTDEHGATVTTSYYDKNKHCWIEKNVKTEVKNLFVK